MVRFFFRCGGGWGGGVFYGEIFWGGETENRLSDSNWLDVNGQMFLDSGDISWLIHLWHWLDLTLELYKFLTEMWFLLSNQVLIISSVTLQAFVWFCRRACKYNSTESVRRAIDSLGFHHTVFTSTMVANSGFTCQLRQVTRGYSKSFYLKLLWFKMKGFHPPGRYQPAPKCHLFFLVQGHMVYVIRNG